MEALVILYLRVVPGFWIAVEESMRPELRSRPVIIGGLPHQRGLVREANLRAQNCGVRPGMSLSQAYQHCPDGVFLMPNPASYEALWEEICSILSAYTPLVEPLEMGHAVCDLSGCERRWTSIGDTALEIVLQVRRRGITPWVGVATNRLVAQMASTTVGPDGVTVIEKGQERAFLADLALASLPEIDPRMALTFQVLGLRTVGQFAALPAPSVKQRFGSDGERLHRWARGIDPRPVLPPPDRHSITARYECEDGSIEEAAEAIRRLAETCAVELQQRHLAGKLITLLLEWEWPGDSSSSVQSSRALHEPVPPDSLLQPPPSGTPISTPQAPQFPVPYRIHSMLPQPAHSQSGPFLSPAPSPEAELPAPFPLEPVAPTRDAYRLVVHRATTRTPVDTASPLIERAQRFLIESWPRDSANGRVSLHAVKLEISEFQEPTQLAFAELSRIDQTGGLRGMDAARLQALMQQEGVLTARYGDASFRHVTHIDPGSVLAERRFRWNAGLPPLRVPHDNRRPPRPKRMGRRQNPGHSMQLPMNDERP
jgi:DNA polymerase-4